ncbi:hypothetical protein DMENIID0001_135620 [Sergentomyia squamirostris]
MFNLSLSSQFNTIDYVAFVVVFVVSYLIGLYYAVWSKRRQNTPEDYFLGGRNMGVIPVAISLLATFVSGINMIGMSTDVYLFGTLHWMYIVTFLIMTIVVIYVFLPIFYDLQLASTFEYIKLRFGRKAQLLASLISMITTTLLVAVNLYVPALILNYILGTSILTGTMFLGTCCIFYTTFGGFRAVVWADLFQTVIILLCSFVILSIGLRMTGGVYEVWNVCDQGGRLKLYDLSLDPTIRLTTWGYLFGNTLVALQQFGLNQSSIQRYLSTSSMTKARSVAVVFYIGYVTTLLLSIATGMVIFTYYKNCDPITSGLVRKPDQVVALFVMEMSQHLPGLQGIFVAGIVAGCLSTMSSFLNSTTVCLYEDFLRPVLPEMSNQKTCNLLKVLTIVLGCVQIGLVFVVQKLGTIVTIIFTVIGLTGGTMLGLFTLGMLVPKANQTGAITGTVTSIVCVAVVIYGGLNKKPCPTLSMSTDGCLHNFTSPLNPSNFEEPEESDDLPLIFRISFMYYATIGIAMVYLVGWPVSLLTGGNTITDQRLLAPFLRKNDLEEPEKAILEKVDLLPDKSA